MPYQDSEAGRAKQTASRLRARLALHADPLRLAARKERMRLHMAAKRAANPSVENAKNRRYYYANLERSRAITRDSNRRRNRDPLRWPTKILERIRSRLKGTGIPFNLEPSDIVVPDRCPVFGTAFVYGAGYRSPHSPSIDRHNPSLGYVKGNVGVISMRANVLKRDCTSGAELRKVADYIDSLTTQGDKRWLTSTRTPRAGT